MDTLRVRHRVSRHILMLAASVLLVVAALDIVWLHEVTDLPVVDEETGALTSRGLSQERSNYLWGFVLFAAAAGLGIVAVSGLVRRASVVALDAEKIALRIAGPNRYLTIPWGEIRWVHSGSEGDDDELVPTRVLLVNVADPQEHPKELWGAEWDGSTLVIDAESWSLPPEEVVAHSRTTLEAWRRRNEAAPESGGGVDEESLS